MKANLVARGRDRRVDFARGLANWFIFVDHIPHNAVSLLTIRNFGFSGAADVLVFVTGYAAAIHFGKMIIERGFLVAASRIFQRVVKLYGAYLVLFVIYINVIGWVAARYAAPDIIQDYHIIGILNDPVRVLRHGLLLEARPLNLDIIQLLIVLLAFFPFALACLLRWPNWTMAGSIALYLAARLFDLGLPAYPRGLATYLNPFCWQVLFVLGAWIALNGGSFVRWVQGIPTLRRLALGYLLVSLLITLAVREPTIGSHVPAALTGPFTPIDRDNLGPYRALHLFALVLLFTYLVPADGKGFHGKVLQPIIICGEQWLTCFCVGVFLSFAAYIVLIMGPNSVLLQVSVSAAGIAMMTAIAYYIAWSRRQDREARLGARA